MKENNNKNRCIISGVDIASLPFGYNEDSGDCQKIKAELLNAIVTLMKRGVEEFYTNCEYGFPLWGSEMVIGLMMYNDVELYVVQPHENQSYKYSGNVQDRYHKIHEKCTDVIPVFIKRDGIEEEMTFYHNRFEDQEDDYDREFLEQKADDYMLDDCGRLLFCGDGRGNYIYEQAVERGLEITIVKTEEE